MEGIEKRRRRKTKVWGKGSIIYRGVDAATCVTHTKTSPEDPNTGVSCAGKNTVHQ